MQRELPSPSLCRHLFLAFWLCFDLLVFSNYSYWLDVKSSSDGYGMRANSIPVFQDTWKVGKCHYRRSRTLLRWAGSHFDFYGRHMLLWEVFRQRRNLRNANFLSSWRDCPRTVISSFYNSNLHPYCDESDYALLLRSYCSAGIRRWSTSWSWNWSFVGEEGEWQRKAEGIDWWSQMDVKGC